MNTITATVTAYNRVDQTLATISQLKRCNPGPAEILVHVDANQVACASAVRAAFPEIEVIVSPDSVGPGGGRNKLVMAARGSLVASFDDDSYPIDTDYFKRVAALMKAFPTASVLCANVFHVNEQVPSAEMTAHWVSDFSGGACIFRRQGFIEAGGYVPIPIAYGMEEVDLAIRLHAQGEKILHCAWLRVFHDTTLDRHADPKVTAASIANIALLTYLRYPRCLWIIGAIQCLKRIRWLLWNGRRLGIAAGLRSTPGIILRYRHYRQRVRASAIKSYLRLRRNSVPVVWNMTECQSHVDHQSD